MLLAGDLCISEFMAANGETLTDSFGESSDWIELTNNSNQTIDLSNFLLTDDVTDLEKYRLPAVDLEPGGTQIIFASSRDLQTDSGEVHANFSLSAGGEYLALVDQEGEVVQDFGDAFPQQSQDISYGIANNFALPLRIGFLATPSPGAANGEVFDGFVEPVTFSLPHGYYESTQTLTLTSESEDATIVYTLDGSDPQVDDDLNPTNGFVFSEPISFSETTVVRAAAFESNRLSAPSRARTYLFTSDIVTQGQPEGFPNPTDPGNNGARLFYGMNAGIVNTFGEEAVADALQSISSISITTDLDNLFDSDSGIYVNAQGRGREWERFSSVELIEPDGDGGFQVNAGLRIRGGFSRNDQFPKRSFRFFFRGEYGDSKLNYDFFGGDGAEEFDVLDLRTAQNYAWSNGNDDRNTFLREVWARDAQGEMGHAHTRSRYHHLYINGTYWGLYQTQERVEAFFGETYLGGDEEDYDRIKNNNANGQLTEAADGNFDDWRLLFDLAQGITSDRFGNNNYWTMQGLNPDGSRNPDLPVLLDVDNLIDYQLLIFLSGGFDTSTSIFLGEQRGNNWVALRDRETDDQGFQFFMHDNEHSLGVIEFISEDRTGPFGDFNSFSTFHPGQLHEDLLLSPEYRLRFQDRVQKHLFNDGVLTEERNIARVEAREEVVAQAILAESARWGGSNARFPLTPDDWQGAVDFVKDWLVGRNERLLGQLQRDGLHSTVNPVVFNQHGGAVDEGFEVVLDQAGNGPIYYTTDGTDPRLPGGNFSPSAILYTGPISVTELTTIKARVRPSQDTWSAVSEATFRVSATEATSENLRITEINYHPADPTLDELEIVPAATDGSFEYIELLNTSDAAIDLTGVQFESTFTFAIGPATLESGQRGILVRDQAAFEARYGGDHLIVGVFGESGGLSNGGAAIELLGASGDTIQSFTYDDGDDWPSLPDGDGSTLQVVDIDGDYSDPLNWLPSLVGTPSTDGSLAASSLGLRVTEINYNPDQGSEFIELFNDSDESIDLTGIRFVEGINFDFTGSSITELAPGEFVLAVRSLDDFESVHGADLPVAGEFISGSLSNGGERLIVLDSSSRVIHDFVYSDSEPWPTSADGEGSSLEIVATDGDYSTASNWTASLVNGGTPGGFGSGVLPCDLSGEGDGCDIADLDALYEGAAGELTDASIVDWLEQASSASNPLKGNSSDIYVLGDINLNGAVDSVDLGLLLNRFGQSARWGGGNLNSDDVVNSVDLGLLLNNFGFTSPEPENAATFAFVGPEDTRSNESTESNRSIGDVVFGEEDEDEDES